jgi:hypothetical protein
MWIISQIGGKNMTGKLQNRACFKFFLTLVRPAFDVGHDFFRRCVKWLTRRRKEDEQKCEYRKKWRNLQPPCVVRQSLFHINSRQSLLHVFVADEKMEGG